MGGKNGKKHVFWSKSPIYSVLVQKMGYIDKEWMKVDCLGNLNIKVWEKNFFSKIWFFSKTATKMMVFLWLKRCFFHFSQNGWIFGFNPKTHSEQVHKVCFSETNWLEHFILTSWKKLIFHVSDSTLYIQKTKILKSEKKWILMAYLSLP